MFDLANDRLSYGELLRPDAGYTLDFAVGMTYSLDLEALLGVPISLGLLEEPEERQMESPLLVLEAIRRSADHLAVFCSADGIKLPRKIQSVYSLLENSVFPVKLKNGGNFHPKLWVLKYTGGDGGPYIKLLVLSRNLTFDTSIDLCAVLRGKLGKARRRKNKPLSEMLAFTSQFARGTKAERVKELAAEVLYISSFAVEPPFEDYAFYPMGIPGYPGGETGLFGEKYDLFAASPFLSQDVVQALTQCRGRKTLVTRKSSVTPDTLSAFDSVYITADVLSDNEFGVRQDIHAKLYFTTSREGNFLYLGSANASHNAFYRNVECLLRLKYRPNTMGFQRFSASFLPEEDPPFQRLEQAPEAAEKDLQQETLDKALREAVYALKSARVFAGEKGGCSVVVSSREREAREPVFLSPLYRVDLERPLERETVFSGLPLKEVGEFYVLRARARRLVVKIETRGIPKERDQAIYRSVIDTREKFLSYLSLVLSEDFAAALAEEDGSFLRRAGAGGTGEAGQAAVYEKLLQVFHESPHRLSGIEETVQKLDSDVVGEAFTQLYKQLKQAERRRAGWN